MNELDLTGQHISLTYPRLLQTDNGLFYDGIGNTVSIGVGSVGPQGPQGSGSSESSLTELTVTGIQNNVNKVFTLSATLTAGTQHMFFINGQLLVYESDYTIQSTTLTLIADRPAPSLYDSLRIFGTVGNVFLGSQGFQGTQGFQGSGIQGFQGPRGDLGLYGPQGYQGPRGDLGLYGPQGNQGFQGPVGITGTNGTDGNQGFQGPVGITGTNGTNGNQGFQGFQGLRGVQGLRGISSGAIYYFNQSQASDVSPYKVLTTQPNGVQQIVTQSGIGANVTRLVSSFLTPQLGFSVIPGGAQRFHFHFLKDANAHDFEAFATFELVNSLGVSYGTVITTGASLIEWIDAATPVEVTTDITIPTITIDPTDRMLIKIYVKNIGSGSRQIKWYTEGTSYYSFVITTVGAIGNEGAQGALGPQGSNGTQGSQGPRGFQGSVNEMLIIAYSIAFA